MSKMKTWKGQVECGMCESVQDAKVLIEPYQDEPVIPIECKECGAVSCMPVYDDTKDNDTQWNTSEPL
jgi:hypothetical protein